MKQHAEKGSESFSSGENDSDPFCELLYDVGFDITGDPASKIAVEVFWPKGTPSRQVFFCLPGGGMNRRYFDLGGDLGGEQNLPFSFARQMAARGFVSVLVDAPGTGDSDRPADGHALTGERVADILARVHTRVVDDLRQGRVCDDLASMPDMTTIGIGHSMGAMLTVLQQFRHPAHAGLALLGFGTRGLPQFLPAEARGMLDDLEALREALPRLALTAFPMPYPELPSNGGEAGLFGSSEADPVAVKALKAANDVLLPVPAIMSMLPGNVAPECAEITVPVYLALGERDLIRDPGKVPAAFSASSDVRLQVLPGTGHSHFLFESRGLLFDGLADWAQGL